MREMQGGIKGRTGQGAARNEEMGKRRGDEVGDFGDWKQYRNTLIDSVLLGNE